MFKYFRLVSLTWSAVKGIMYQKTIDKVRFIGEDEMGGVLQEYIPIENIPREFGGIDEDYERLYIN